MGSASGRGPLLIDASYIRRINSCGTRDWIEWKDALKEHYEVFISRCSVAVVNQANLVHNFLQSCTVVDFFAPYYCSACDSEWLLLMTASSAESIVKAGNELLLRCDECDRPLEVDAIQDQYFRFLERLDTGAVSSELFQRARSILQGRTQGGRDLGVVLNNATLSVRQYPNVGGAAPTFGHTYTSSVSPVSIPEKEPAISAPVLPAAPEPRRVPKVLVLVLGIALLFFGFAVCVRMFFKCN